MEMVISFGLSCIFYHHFDKDGDPEMTVLFHEAA